MGLDYAAFISEPMTDTLTREERSRRMGLIRSRDTKPEIRVRRLLHSLGYRFRVRGLDLLGRPDVVFLPRRKAIFVHGCFWHRHPGCARTRTPKSRTEFWESKFRRNVDRDLEVMDGLTNMGWETLVVWECQTERIDELRPRLTDFLGETREVY